MARRNGSIIGPRNAPTTSSAKGVWSLNEVEAARQASIWPLKPASISYCTYASDTSDLTTYTFSSQSIGTAATGRYVIAAVQLTASSTPAFSSVTIAGVAATLIGSSTTNTNIRMAFYGAQVDTGTTGNVVVVATGGCISCAVAIWAAYDLLSYTPVDSGVSTANPGADTLTTSNGGIAVAMATNGGSLGTYTWTGLTEDFDATFDASLAGSGSGASANIATGSNLSITATRTGGAANDGMITASFR